MKKDFCALTFSEKERICEEVFINNGPYWHVYTDGTGMQDIFCTDEDFDIGMWILASAVCASKEGRAITFEIMSNHIHMIMSGMKDSCMEVFRIFKERLRRVMQQKNRIIDWKEFNVNILPIESLRALRNEIIYTHRNAYVASPKYTPDSYPWGGGWVFFNTWLDQLPVKDFSKLSIDRRRELTHSRDTSEYHRLKVVGEHVFIPSFCDIRLGESLFADPRSYFHALTRNAEAFSQIAEALKDTLFLTDDELYAATIFLINKEYDVRNTAHLTPAQKIECARNLRVKYNATKQQIRRILRLDEKILSELFHS